MSNDINSITVCGRITRDADIKTIPTGSLVAKFSIANNYYQKGKENAVNYFDIEYWCTDKVSPFLTKGKQIIITGELRQETWSDSDGIKKSRMKIIASKVQFIGDKPVVISDTPTGDIPF